MRIESNRSSEKSSLCFTLSCRNWALWHTLENRRRSPSQALVVLIRLSTKLSSQGYKINSGHIFIQQVSILSFRSRKRMSAGEDRKLKTAIGLRLNIKSLHITIHLRSRAVLEQGHSEVSHIAQIDSTAFHDKVEQHLDQAGVGEAVRWLSATDHRARKQQLHTSSIPVTGNWLIQSPAFKHCCTGPGRLLFCPGTKSWQDCASRPCCQVSGG